jgi:hypothetical protein
MPSHHRLPDRIPHKVDTLGIAVALAILVGIGLFAGNQDQRSMAEDPTSNVVAEVKDALHEQKNGSALDLMDSTHHERHHHDLAVSPLPLSQRNGPSVD